jgi:hypothetical protein
LAKTTGQCDFEPLIGLRENNKKYNNEQQIKNIAGAASYP